MVEMSDWDHEDPLTRLNTQLNRSMVLMENVTKHSPQLNRSNKSIKISTVAKPPNANSSTNSVRRKSILKKSESTNNEEINIDNGEGKDNNTNEERNIADDKERNSVDSDRGANFEILTDTVPVNKAVKSSSRPSNLRELMQEESLSLETTSSSLNFSDISDSEDIWIMDIPKTIDPKDLNGQTLVLGDKSKFKVGDEKYCAVNRDIRQNLTCVFNTSKTKSRYKAVNIKPAGSIVVRRKLSGISKVKPVSLENLGVPFPENLKVRHPLFGVISESKFKKEPRSKKKK